MIKPVSELGYETDPAPTTETWATYLEEQEYICAPDGYVDGTFNFLEKLEPILLLEDLQVMKVKLTELYHEKYTLVKHALDYDS